MKHKKEFGITCDFELIGLVASLRPYRLAWLLNQSFDLTMEMQPIGKIELLNQAILEVIWFKGKSTSLSMELICNRVYSNPRICLLDNFRQYDYWIKVISFNELSIAKSCVEQLKTISEIEWVESIGLEKVKNLDYLFLE